MLRLCRWTGRRLGVLSFYLGFRTAVTLENLYKAFPEYSTDELNTIARRSYANLGCVFLEMLYLRFAGRDTVRDQFEIENMEVITKSVEDNRGALFISGHCANWEWMASGVALRLNHPLSVIIKNQRNKRVESFLVRMRTRFGNTMVDAGNVRAIFGALGRAKYIALLSDQNAPSEAVYVDFFGRQVPAFEGTARLALRFKVPLFFVEAVRKGSGKYCATVHVIPTNDLEGDSTENILKLTQRHTTLLEIAIRKHPELWLWQHRRWKYAKP